MEGQATRILGWAPWLFIGFGGLMVLTGALFAWSDPAALAAVPFGAVFIAVGWVSRRLIHPPEGMKHVVVESNTSWISRINGTAGTHRQATAILAPEDADDDDVRADWLSGRLALRPDWIARRVQPEGELETGLLALTAGVAGTVALGALLVAVVGDNGIAWVIAAGGGLVSALMLGRIVRERWHRRKFGASVFAADEMPFRLGGTVSGTVETGIRPRGGASHPEFSVELSCRKRRKETSGSGSDRTTSIREDVLWQATAAPRARLSRGGRVTAPVSIPVPDGLPAASLRGTSDGIFWILAVRAPMPGLDYGVSFSLPVLAAGTTVTLPAPPAPRR